MLRYFFLYEYFYIWGVFNVVSVGLYLWTFQEPKEQWWIPFLQLNIEFLNYVLFLFSFFFFVFILFCKLFVVYLRIAKFQPLLCQQFRTEWQVYLFFSPKALRLQEFMLILPLGNPKFVNNFFQQFFKYWTGNCGGMIICEKLIDTGLLIFQFWLLIFCYF